MRLQALLLTKVRSRRAAGRRGPGAGLPEKVKELNFLPRKFALILVLGSFVFLSLSAVAGSAQALWEEEDPKFPVYNRLIRRYRALKPDLNKEDFSAGEKEDLLRRARALKLDVQDREFRARTTPNTSEELKSRLKFFREALEKHVRRLEEYTPRVTTTPVSLPDPWESVGFTERVNEYRTAEEELRTHLCHEPAEGAAAGERAAWRRRRDELLLQMIMAEETLAFAASGSFTRADQDKLEPVFPKLDEIRRLLEEAGRHDEKAAELQRLFEQYEKSYNWHVADAGNKHHAGQFVLPLYLGMRRVEEELDRAQNLSARTKTAIIAPLREVRQTAASVYGDMRARGIREINRRLGADAVPFRIHRPVERAQREELERRLLEFINSQMGVGLGIPPGTGSFPENVGLAYTSFDEAEQRRFVDNQCRADAVARLSLAKTTFAAGEDVNISYVLPLNLRRVPLWVGLMPSSEPHRDVDSSREDTRKYQEKRVESRAEGVLWYPAPQTAGSYDVRLFERASGREVAAVSFRVEPGPRRFDLNGQWVGKGYGCALGGSHEQVIVIRHTGDQFVATKVVGDNCIGPGEVTLRGSYTTNHFNGQIQVINLGTKVKSFVDVSIKVENRNLITVMGVGVNLTLRRRTD